MERDTAEHKRLESLGWSRLEDEGYVELIGPIWHRHDEHGSAYGLLAESKHHNRRGVVQGGLIMTFLDRALGGTIRDANGNLPQTTVQLDVHFVDAAQVGEFLEARARAVRVTRYIAFVEGEVTVGDRTIATAKGIWKILRPASASQQNATF